MLRSDARYSASVQYIKSDINVIYRKTTLRLQYCRDNALHGTDIAEIMRLFIKLFIVILKFAVIDIPLDFPS